MRKNRIRLSESDLHRIIKESVKRVLRESEDDFEQRYNDAMDGHLNRGGLWGFELKKDGDWEYGNIEYSPNKQTMSCMGVTIDVDPSLSVDQNIEGLYDELLQNGYNDGSDEE